MAEFVDVAMNTDKGYYDISFENGDFKKLKGLDTAVFITLFTDARASATDMDQPERRRGWIGNLDNLVELGNKNWLYEQAKLINRTVNGLVDSTKQGFKWLTDLGYANIVTVKTIRTATQLDADILIERPNGTVESRRVTLWENTPNG